MENLQTIEQKEDFFLTGSVNMWKISQKMTFYKIMLSGVKQIICSLSLFFKDTATKDAFPGALTPSREKARKREGGLISEASVAGNTGRLFSLSAWVPLIASTSGSGKLKQTPDCEGAVLPPSRSKPLQSFKSQSKMKLL